MSDTTQQLPAVFCYNLIKTANFAALFNDLKNYLAKSYE
jgi:hypothetical protein